MSEAPGFFNKLFGRGKRWLVISSLLIVIATLLVTQRSAIDTDAVVFSAHGKAVPSERKQIWGDSAIIESAAKKNWRVIFNNPADRLLAIFAQPGHIVKPTLLPTTIEADFLKSIKTEVIIEKNELEEYKQMKCLVAGMKLEALQYIADGGNFNQYYNRLLERQQAECKFLETSKKTLEKAAQKKNVDVIKLWKETNHQLRALGLPTIAMPESY